MPSSPGWEIEPWRIVAHNLAEHAVNPIHTDAGAQAAGFPRALVAGVTTYAYLTHPVLDRWGRAWLEAGGAEVRLRSPVFDCDELEFPATRANDALDVTVRRIGTSETLAALTATERGPSDPYDPDSGDALEPLVVTLADRYGADYAARAGDDQPVCVEHGLVHPAVWPALANSITHAQVATGPWVHVRSRIRHHRAVAVGAGAVARAAVVDRFRTRAGERAVLHVAFTVDGEVVTSLEHEALVTLH